MKSWRIHAGIYPLRWRKRLGGTSRREMLERKNGDLDDPPNDLGKFLYCTSWAIWG